MNTPQTSEAMIEALQASIAASKAKRAEGVKVRRAAMRAGLELLGGITRMVEHDKALASRADTIGPQTIDRARAALTLPAAGAADVGDFRPTPGERASWPRRRR